MDEKQVLETVTKLLELNLINEYDIPEDVFTSMESAGVSKEDIRNLKRLALDYEEWTETKEGKTYIRAYGEYPNFLQLSPGDMRTYHFIDTFRSKTGGVPLLDNNSMLELERTGLVRFERDDTDFTACILTDIALEQIIEITNANKEKQKVKNDFIEKMLQAFYEWRKKKLNP